MVQTTVEEAYELKKKNAGIYWRDVVRKEIKNGIVAFEILDPSEQVPVGYSRLKAHRHDWLLMGIRLRIL